MYSLAEHTEVLEARINCLIDKLLEHYNKQYGDGGIEFHIVRGTKYYKIIEKSTRRNSLGGDGGSVHAFIHRQSGAVYKPASWKAPAKHVRYNLLDDVSYETCLHNADWPGHYLYMK
jgi:hypothetical protein